MKKHSGFTIFELTLTIVITSIVFGIVGVFMAKPILLFTEISGQSSAANQLSTALNVIANDFSRYTGGISVNSYAANTVSVRFNITGNVAITYTCDFNANQVYRISGTQGNQTLLTNLNSCYFRNSVSADLKTLFLSVRLGINQNNMPVTLTEVLNVPNV